MVTVLMAIWKIKYWVFTPSDLIDFAKLTREYPADISKDWTSVADK